MVRSWRCKSWEKRRLGVIFLPLLRLRVTLLKLVVMSSYGDAVPACASGGKPLMLTELFFACVAVVLRGIENGVESHAE